MARARYVKPNTVVNKYISFYLKCLEIILSNTIFSFLVDYTG